MKKIYAFLISTITIILLLASCSAKPVEITIPANMIKAANIAGIVITSEQETTNNDDSVTYVITKSNHSKLLEDATDNIDALLADIFARKGADEMLEKIEFNDDYTTLTIEIHDAAANQMLVLFMLPKLGFNAEMYQHFNGVEDPSITATIIDATTDEVVFEKIIP